MGILEALGIGISSILGGGATGLLGIVAQRFFDWLHVKEKAKMQLEQNKHELAVLNAEWQGKLGVAKEQGEAQRDVADSGALAASYQGAFERFATWDMKKDAWYIKIPMVLLDVIRGIVRPGLTLYLAWITTEIYRETRAILDAEGVTLTSEQTMMLLVYLIATICYLFTTCVTWWFGTRNKAVAPKLA
jgi:hypothetical protein